MELLENLSRLVRTKCKNKKFESSQCNIFIVKCLEKKKKKEIKRKKLKEKKEL